MSRLASAIVALAAAALIAATGAEAMPANAAANARIQANADLASGQNNLATQVRSTRPASAMDARLGGAAAITRPDGARVAKLDGITPRCLLGYDGSSQARDGEVTAKEAAPPLPCAEAWFSTPIRATGVSGGEKARLANPTDVVRSTRVNKGVARGVSVGGLRP